jgi:hypothetical protein
MRHYLVTRGMRYKGLCLGVVMGGGRVCIHGVETDDDTLSLYFNYINPKS